MVRRNRYGKEFKEKIVMELISGQSSVAQLAQRENINPQTIRNWRKETEGGTFQADHEVEIALRKRIAELEGTLADSALTVHILKKTEHYLKEMRRKEKSSGSISPENSASSRVVKRLK
ncbi:MAG: transposase [Spirochaetia bacterium]|nr:transposase [Spirochaetia bacterium]